MSGLFISYRRSQSEAWAGRLADRLKDEFGDHNVFVDVEDISPGEDFEQVILSVLETVDAVLVVIGLGWTTAADEDGPRLFRHDDYVRREVAIALASDTLVLPILVDGSSMPSAEELPDDLQSLTKRNATTVSSVGFQAEVDRIVKALRPKAPWWARRKYQYLAAAVVALVIAVAVIATAVVNSGQGDDGLVAGTNGTATTPSAEGASSTQSGDEPGASTPLASESLATAIAVTAEDVGTGFAGYRLWIIPESVADEAVTLLEDSFEDFDEFAAASGGVPSSPQDDPRVIQVIVQGTPRLADESIAVAIIGLNIQVLAASEPARGKIAGFGLPLTDEPLPVDVFVVLPEAVNQPSTVTFEVDGEPAPRLPAFSLGPTDSVIIRIEVDATNCMCVWKGELEVLLAGERHMFPILDAAGEPFTVSGEANATGELRR